MAESKKVQELRRKGEQIAVLLGPSITYMGPQMIGSVFGYHLFQDNVTDSSFTGRNEIDSKASLMANRARYKAHIPPFPIPNPLEVVSKLDAQVNRIVSRVTKL